ncbi:MFS transporter [Bosea sp. F3-2]|uniref:MFS transporter n=1 Tax=Bosea sp. F3-2 TaxID=2599640 RepID=UPI0020BF52B3|nr:MFS transporter [Bosea sp. F3-2]
MSSLPTTPSVAERPLTRGTIFLLAGLAALGSLATNIILPAFPRIGASLGVSSQELGLTLSSFFVAFALGQLVVGPFSDRFGRKWLVLGGLAVFAAGSIFCALAETLSLLVLGRVIQALGACAASVLSRAIARDLFDGEALARALALTMIAGAAAPGFSPLLGGALDGLFGWRVTFLVVAAFGMMLGLHYSTSVGETHPADRRATLTASAVASAYGRLAFDPLFLFPALSVGLVIGGLYTFFAAAPAILTIHGREAIEALPHACRPDEDGRVVPGGVAAASRPYQCRISRVGRSRPSKVGPSSLPAQAPALTTRRPARIVSWSVRSST